MHTEPPESLLGPHGVYSICAIAAKAPVGCFVEFGVYRGGSAWHLAQLAQEQGREIYLYDTFAGIPYRREIDNHLVGDFADADYESVCANIPYAKVVKGVFPDSLVTMPQIAFAHIDADQYDSIHAAVKKFGPLMARGGVMVFDDVPCLRGATQALLDLQVEYELTDNNKALVRF
jgi:hypothetical protein